MSSSKATATAAEKENEKKPQQKPNPSLEEDDEFEDFPVEDWSDADADKGGKNTTLWEESWDDDDTTDDFSAQLREELRKA